MRKSTQQKVTEEREMRRRKRRGEGRKRRKGRRGKEEKENREKGKRVNACTILAIFFPETNYFELESLLKENMEEGREVEDATAARWVTREEWLSREGVVSEPRGPRPVGCWRRGRRSEAPGVEQGAPRRGRPPVRLGRCGSLPGRGQHYAPCKKSRGDQWAGGCGVRRWEIEVRTRGSQAET